MKPIQVMMDETLLDKLDDDEEVRRLGRSAIFRLMAAKYIEHRRRWAISSKYAKAYGAETNGLEDEMNGWESEGEWPDE